MKTKVISLFLASVLVIGTLAGCQSSELKAYSDKDTEDSGSQEAAALDYTAAFNVYDPDEVMLTVNGIDVKWRELFHWLVSSVGYIEQKYGPITDWDAACPLDEEKTIKEYVSEYALEMVTSLRAMESKAKEMNVSLSQEDKDEIQKMWEENVEGYGGDEAAFLEYLGKSFIDRELYDQFNESNILYKLSLNETYGEKGEKLEEKQVLEEAEDMGYKYVKHILFINTDNEGNPLSETEIAAKKTKAEEVLSQLSGITDQAALEAKFDELMAENTEDPGIEQYKEGYIYAEGMMENFSNAVDELEDYQLSDLVETDVGYHIILRLPLRTDVAVIGGESALPAYVAQKLFSSLIENWTDEAEVEMKDAYKDMDLKKVFEKE